MALLTLNSDARIQALIEVAAACAKEMASPLRGLDICASRDFTNFQNSVAQNEQY